VSGRCPIEPKPIVHGRLRGGRIRAPNLPRKKGLLYYLTHWYTFRTVVGVLLGAVIGLLIFGTYFAQTFPLHPEDRLLPSNDKPDPNVVIVGIDDKSIKEVGHFPFARDRFQTVLDNLHQAGAAVTVFDVGFSESTAGPGDDLFATAIGKDGPVILAYGQSGLADGTHDYVYTDQADNNRPLDKFICGNPKALPGCKPVAELGATAVILDNDQVVRRMPMFLQAPCVSKDTASHCQAGVLNPLGFLAYRRLSLGPDTTGQSDLQYGTDGATFGTAWVHPLPVDQHGVATIGWSGGPTYMKANGQYLSFSDVYRNNFDRSKIDSKIVLIGVYGATAIHDEQLVAPTGPNNGNVMNGIEIHANVIQMLNSLGQIKFVQPEPPAAVLLSILVICVLLGVVLPRLSALYGFVATVGVSVIYTVAWIPLSTTLRIVPDFFHIWLAIGLTYAALMAYRFFYEEREKRKVKSIFGQYLKPELVENMARARSIEDIMVGGERKELSLLFVDIRGFTHMSEGMEAQDVLRVIDLYLEELTNVVFRWDGTLDKYVGDEIMAFWNAPHTQDGHALLAVRCAWEMIAKLPEIQARLEADGLPIIQYGIGINTGPVSIGIMGSKGRRAYTALGDTVNTAARFCGHAGPTQILIGQKTYEECSDYIAVDMVPGVQLKGKSAEKFTIYRVTAIREAPGQPWATAPGLESYSEVGVYTQQTMIGAGATVSVETGRPTAEHLLDTAEFQLPSEPAAPLT
jgi:adenylate cyclase